MLGVSMFLALAAWPQGAGGAGGPAAQQGEAQGARFKVALRVSGTRADGLLVVDRGSRDRVAVGDVVVLAPRGGAEVSGSVREVFEQRATVALDAPAAAELAAGTRGYVLVRSGPSAAPDAAGGAAPAPGTERPGGAGATAGPGRSPSGARPEPAAPDDGPARGAGGVDWPALDDGWTPDQPLLAGVRAQRPEERPRAVTGRVWTSFDAIFGEGGGRRDTFFRAGGEVSLTNPFGRGGELVLDGELVHRTTTVPPEANGGTDESANLRVDRLFYEVGGTRFDADRWTFGRFVSRDLPELGVQDGVEWSRRLSNGHRIGASAAFLPVPDGTLDGASDLSFAGWYRWVRDAREETMVTAGFQHTFHDGTSDRDRVLLRAHHLPADGWTFLGSAWIDLHDGDPLDDGLALTEAHASVGRRFDGLHDLRLVATHREYPDLRTDEAALVGVESIAEGRLDRVGVAGSARLTADRRLTGRVGLWADERDEGGDLDLGVDLPLAVARGTRLRLAGFAAQGRSSELRGGRIGLARELEHSAWSLAYEVQLDTFEGFDELNDDAVQHRVRAETQRYSAGGWVLSLYAEAQLHDLGDAFLVGFHLGRSF